MRPPDAVQNLNGFGSIGCFENLKSRIAQATCDCQTQEHVVFHNQDDRRRLGRQLLAKHVVPQGRGTNSGSWTCKD